MAVKVHSIMTGRSTAELEWGGGIVHLTYDSNAYTPAVEEEWMKVEQEGWAGKIVTTFLETLLIDWDVLGDYDVEGKRFIDIDTPYPFEKIKYLPGEFLSSCMNAIMQDVRPGKETSSS